MIAGKIDTHVQDALNRMLAQYKDLPRLSGLITAFVEQIQDLEDALYDIDSSRQIWNGTTTPAVGMQLDQLGTLVGIARNGLSDAEYILFLFGKIAANNSDTTVPTLLNVISYIFQAQQVLVQEQYPAGLSIQVIGTPLEKSFYSIAGSLVESALGAGISLVFIGGSSSVNVFRFAGPRVSGSVNGFSGVSEPDTGGVFVALIS